MAESSKAFAGNVKKVGKIQQKDGTVKYCVHLDSYKNPVRIVLKQNERAPAVGDKIVGHTSFYHPNGLGRLIFNAPQSTIDYITGKWKLKD